MTGNQTIDLSVHRPVLGPLSHTKQGTVFLKSLCAFLFFQSPLEKSEEMLMCFSFTVVIQALGRFSPTSSWCPGEHPGLLAAMCPPRSLFALPSLLRAAALNWLLPLLICRNDEKCSSLPSVLGFFSKCFLVICQMSGWPIVFFMQNMRFFTLKMTILIRA